MVQCLICYLQVFHKYVCLFFGGGGQFASFLPVSHNWGDPDPPADAFFISSPASCPEKGDRCHCDGVQLKHKQILEDDNSVGLDEWWTPWQMWLMDFISINVFTEV